jgi:heme-degrading monooxygenase HmoA
MYVVIFKASIANFDDEYFRTAEQLKELAFKKYACQDFVSSTEGDQEIAVSYWNTLQDIKDWKRDPQHRLAQKMGRDNWYQSVSVEICELLKSY